MLLLLNYFWLDWDPRLSAKWYCDQHCFKIGAEVIESVWDVILYITPSLAEEALERGIPPTYRRKRHSRDGTLWHPLSVWNGLCRSNMRRSLINANCIFEEHYCRTGKRHSAWEDCLFLLDRIEGVDFTSDLWKRWYDTQNGQDLPGKRGEDRRKWMEVHDVPHRSNRNICFMSEPPQCINEDQFPLCRVEGNVVKAYRNYYEKKTETVSGGKMRYYYTPPPSWLKGRVCTR